MNTLQNTNQKLNIVSSSCTRIIKLSNNHVWTFEEDAESVGPAITGTLFLHDPREGDEFWENINKMEASEIMSNWENSDLSF